MKVIVIGAGISGLTAAIYARRSGWETVVLEKAAVPGGLSTSWKRRGFTFEGGIHWLIGSVGTIPLHDIWTETGALQENNPVYYKDPVYTLIDGDARIPLYRDFHGLPVKGLRDRLALLGLKFHVRCFKHFHQPITDLRGLKVAAPRSFSAWEYVRMLPAVIVTPFLMLQSSRFYARRFSDKRIRALLGAVVDPDINALSLIYTLSTFAFGDSGYPAGGSLRMAGNMADRLRSLGGDIRYGTTALGVERKAGGWSVRTGKGTYEADAVIISADARTAIDKLFREPLTEPWARKMRKGLRTTQCMFMGLGVQDSLSGWPRSMHIVLREPFHAAGITYHGLTVNSYPYETGYAPEGCCALTCLLHGESYDFWNKAKEAGLYQQEKQDVVDRFIEVLSGVIPEIRDKVTVTDMATPLTYERYCDTFEGSYMSSWPARKALFHAPIRYKRGLYFAGQRTLYSGGLPPAAQSGRIAAQALCRDFGMIFNTGVLRYDLGEGAEAFSTYRDAVLPFPVVQGHQVHGDKIAVVDRADMTREELEGYDAFVTNLPGVAVGARTADCVPVLLYDPVKRVVAAVHAGWKGTVLRIVQSVIGTMAGEFGTSPSDLKAVVGPSIGPNSFQVGEEVAAGFREAGFPMESILSFRGDGDGTPMSGGLHIDLWEANRWLLEQAGVRSENIRLTGIDTYTAKAFFSARREGIKCGRIINAIRLV